VTLRVTAGLPVASRGGNTSGNGGGNSTPTVHSQEAHKHASSRHCRPARASAAAAEAVTEQPSLFWQDEHAVQRQHSLGNPSAPFLLADTESSLVEQLVAQATVLRGRLEGVKLRDLARCDATEASEAAGGRRSGPLSQEWKTIKTQS
jgi:hypothetical protein